MLMIADEREYEENRKTRRKGAFGCFYLQQGCI